MFFFNSLLFEFFSNGIIVLGYLRKYLFHIFCKRTLLSRDSDGHTHITGSYSSLKLSSTVEYEDYYSSSLVGAVVVRASAHRSREDDDVETQ